MTEDKKRLLLCCGIGWFLGGSSVFDVVMATLGVLVMLLRVACFTAEGELRLWIKRSRGQAGS